MVKTKNRNYKIGGWRFETIKTEIVPFNLIYHGPPTIMKSWRHFTSALRRCFNLVSTPHRKNSFRHCHFIKNMNLIKVFFITQKHPRLRAFLFLSQNY